MATIQSATERLANWATALVLDNIPADVVEKAKLHILDTLGCAIGAVDSKVGASLIDSSNGLLFNGPATGIGIGRRLSAERAAFVNGALSHTLDFDDTHSNSSCHVSAVVLPAALAAAEYEGLSGPELVTAFICGVEATSLIGSVCPGAFHRHGLHPTGILGPFGSTLAVARLLGLSAETTANALGIAGSFSAGTFAYLSNGSNVKPIHAGNAARAGIEAVNLAHRGFTGPMEVIEGRDGIYGAFLGMTDLDLSVFDRLGEDWQTLELSIKAYPSCLATHSAIRATLKLREEHGFRAEDVMKVEALVRERDVPLVVEPLERRRVPETTADARFSLPYTVAIALEHGVVDNTHFTLDGATNLEILRITSSFEYSVYHFNGFDSQFSGGVRLTLRDGNVLERIVLDHPGSIENPLAGDTIRAKFRTNAVPVVGSEAAERIIDLVDRIDELSDVLPLTECLENVQA